MNDEFIYTIVVILNLVGIFFTIWLLTTTSRSTKELQQNSKRAAKIEPSHDDKTISQNPVPNPYIEYYELRKLNPYPQFGEYIRFTNLVIESGYNTPYTEIDELIVSRFGIFCIEQKDHHGVILGKKYDKSWTQCMHHYKGKLVNPSRQNYKHRKSLEKLFANKLHSNIHTYFCFPKAYRVVTDDCTLFTSYEKMWRMIQSFKKPIYTVEEVKELARILQYESSRKENRMIIHIATLKYHLASHNL